ncbi:restriction endonuclease subunit S [Priestia megaterium]|uniref:restriction endonuclease subunit S n=1 Tax=Priestia megaterium TaxID=1404 RepID=UPI0011B5F223|nr:restriction endonuclease subunit S [Priestia megaterium]QDZ83533.1 hypothetical protein D0441_03515 [Priestia megaterium]
MEALLQHFHEAVITETDVEQLKKLILQLAFQGKLIRKDQNDEPVSLLFTRILEERQRLIKEKKIKKEKPLPPISLEEMPYLLPTGWEWERIGNVVKVISGYAFKSGDFSDSDGIKSIKITNIGVGNFVFGTTANLPKEFIHEYKEYLVFENDILIALTRPYIKDGLKVCLCPKSYNQTLLNQRVASLRGLFSGVLNEYVFYYFNSPIVLDYVKNYSRTMNQPNLSINSLKRLPIPLPSYETQVRVSNRIKELFAICDSLKEEIKQKEQSSSIMNKSIFKRIEDYNNPSQIQDLQLVVENIKHFCNTKEDIELLRKSILSLAIQGKLIKQVPTDEPVTVLLKKIKEEKEKLIKEKKIKKEKEFPQITDEEKPFELPPGWEWTRLKEVTYNLGQKKPDKKFTYIDVGLINKEKGVISEGAQTNILLPEEAPSRARKIVKKGSVIYSTVRPYLLNIAIVNQDFKHEPIVSTAFAVLNTFNGIENKYLYYYLRSQPFIDYVEGMMVGMAYPAINEANFYKGCLPLPPTNEQKHIVEKVDQLMILCDQLEANIEQSKQEADKLMQAVLQEASSVKKEVLS